VDVTYSATNEGLKESFILADSSAQSSFTFDLRTSPGLLSVPRGDGGIDFTSATGEFEFSIPPPFMYDATHDQGGETSRAVSYSLAPAPSGEQLTLTADRAWLEDPARVWPVTIDPSVTTFQPPNSDCHISQAQQTTSLCYDTRIKVGLGVDGFKRRMLLRFNVQPTIPSGATVTSADLALYATGGSTTNNETVEVRKVNKFFDTNATWQKYDANNQWSNFGGDFGATVYSTLGLNGATAGYKHWYPTTLVQQWVDGTYSNDGILMKADTETVTNVVSFASRQEPNSSQQPYLTVNWNSAPSVSSSSVSPNPVSAGSTVTFNVNWSDPNSGEQVKAVVCKTNSMSSGSCPGGAWAIGGLSTANPASTSYSTRMADVGTQTYYAFVCDSSNFCSGSSSGTFTVTNSPPSITTFNDSPDPVGWGNQTTFSVTWSDPNSGDTEKA
jgi:hypothetical protein